MTTDHNGLSAGDMPGLALRLDSIEARELADLSSVIQDLKFVNSCCERLWSEMQKEAAEQDDVLVQALWSAALVAYWRCFGSGKRAPLRRSDINIVPLQGEVMEWHDHLCDLRSKHIAHSVNPYEQMTVGVIPDSNGLVQAVMTFHAMHLTVDEKDVTQTAALTVELVKLLNDRLVAQQDEMIADLRSRGPGATAGLLPLNITIHGPQDGNRPRRR
jgi:hypothetical protein